ncbi:MAG: glycosyl hydrolase, partial [Planctomycetes bacterium]|nr:glycosyl hydrolase [Planctomycetota bacterium]
GLSAEAVPQGDGWAVTVRTDQFAHFVTIDAPGAVADDDWFHLPPGDVRTVTVRAADGAVPRSGEVRALNGEHSCAIRLERAGA